MKLNLNSKAKMKGTYVLTEADVSSQEAKDQYTLIEAARKMMRGAHTASLKKYWHDEFMKLLRAFNAKFICNQSIVFNLVTTDGFDTIAEALTNASPASADAAHITYGAVGTDNTAATEGDTQLGTEVFRDLIDSQSKSSGVAYNTFFLGLGESNGDTLQEFALFNGNASGTTDSGNCFARVVISPSFDKTAAKTLTIDASHTLANA